MQIVLATLHVRSSPQAVPLAAACLAATLPSKQHSSTHLVDLYPDQDVGRMAELILEQDPALVFFPLYVWNHKAIVTLAAYLRQRIPEITIIAGGPEATATAEGLLASGFFDGIVRGEGEPVFAELVQCCCEGRPFDSPGVLTPSGPKEVGRVPPPALADLPSPWLSGILDPAATGGVLWETSRGCPFACDFCFDARGSNQLRTFPMERLEKEIELFVKTAVSQIWVLDSTFNHPPDRGKKLLKLLIDKAPHIHFHFEAKADFIDREMAHLLAELSCSVQIGLQTVNPAALKHIHRPFEREEFNRKISLLAVEGITYGLDVIYGLPGDNYAGFCQSLEFALGLRPNQVDIFPLAVLPGTILHRDREKLGLEFERQPPYEIVSTPDFSREDLAKARLLTAATNIFYNRGRAVGFFVPLMQAVDLEACTMLGKFLDWMEENRTDSHSRILSAEDWQPREIRDLQMEFTADLLKACGKGHLLPAARDLIRYHYYYAETVLSPETLPAESEKVRGLDLWTTNWVLNSASRVVRFRFEIIDLLQVEDMDLEQFISLFRPVGSTALFLRRGNEVYCESLEEDFSKLLEGSDGTRAPRDIFAGSINRREGEEFVEFAVSEGILLPPERQCIVES